ncbi:hypothetical protein K1719_020960 [Acacia pycnantha]|nr:hypothetical protein K1719_020960 [Acacia pycnantha]
MSEINFDNGSYSDSYMHVFNERQNMNDIKLTLDTLLRLFSSQFLRVRGPWTMRSCNVKRQLRATVALRLRLSRQMRAVMQAGGRRWEPLVAMVMTARIQASDGGVERLECRTRTTPLWRAGPDGPRSLCNACGLRFRKRMAIRGRNSAESQKRRKRTPTHRVMKKLKEEEEAAILLMALSSGSDARS